MKGAPTKPRSGTWSRLVRSRIWSMMKLMETRGSKGVCRSTSAGAAITEYAPHGQTGMAAGQGYLIVPAGNVLTAWKLRP